jgi:hypothetical protein
VAGLGGGGGIGVQDFNLNGMNCDLPLVSMVMALRVSRVDLVRLGSMEAGGDESTLEEVRTMKTD